MNLYETFDNSSFDSRLTWYNPPQTWKIHNSCLMIQPDAKTDYWQKTHYGFVADNGHFLFTEVTANVTITTRVRFEPVHQYDQAGLMVRISPYCWLKTSVEYEPDEPNRLGAVVTNYGYSDWSTQDFSDDCHELLLQIRREQRDYFVEYALPSSQAQGNSGHEWSQIRMAHLHEETADNPVQCGLYACSPIGAGYSAHFDFLKIV